MLLSLSASLFGKVRKKFRGWDGSLVLVINQLFLNDTGKATRCWANALCIIVTIALSISSYLLSSPTLCEILC